MKGEAVSRETKSLTFIQTNDVHWQLANPKARIDVYSEAISNKLFEIFDLARKTKADGILIAGDLTNTPGLSLTGIADLGWILMQSPCPIYTIAGQHDEWDHTPRSLDRTPYGMLRKLGIIRDVDDEPGTLSVGGTEVLITGRHYDHRADETKEYYMPPVESDRVKDYFIIHLAHGMILDRRPGFEMKHTLLSQLKTSANILCVGDYHPGIGIRQAGNGDTGINGGRGTTVINVGALARKEGSVGEMERQVKVAVIKVFEDGSFTAEAVPVKCALPGTSVLSREHLEAEAARNDRMDKFLALLASEGDLRFLEVRDIIEDLSARENVPLTVKLEGLRRIGEAREQLGLGVQV
jgi:exonuclease SbcD